MFNWIKGFFSKIINGLKEFFIAAFPVARQIILMALNDVALNAVTIMNSKNLTNEEKRSAVFKEIKDYSMIKGINARDSLINALIEITVLSLKKYL